MDDETKKKIESLQISIGATAELLGFMRSQLITNGFTKEEAVGLCAVMLLKIITSNEESA